MPLRAQSGDDIQFDLATTQAEFSEFARIVGQGIFATPVTPARATGILRFDVGIAATLVAVDTKASYWRHAVPAGNDFTRNGYAAVPRLVVSKGFGAGTISAMYAKINDSGIATWGGALDVPIFRGSVATPEIAVRGSYATLTGIDVFKLKTYGAEAFISKGFGPITPYAAIGRQKIDARGEFPPVASPVALPELRETGSFNRLTAGVRISLLVPKLVIEATQAEVRSYAAKISVGF
ncbi:MAG: hypothetical protein AABO58_23525 [Acidobacteriota bacterium]